MSATAILLLVSTAVVQPLQARLPDSSENSITKNSALGILRQVSNRTLTYSIDIPAGPLGPALVTLAKQTGINISSDAVVVSGRVTQGVSGPMTAQRALQRLLINSGLTQRRLGDEGFLISAPPVRTAQATELQGIIVEGEVVRRTQQDSQTSVAIVTGDELESRSDPDLYQVIERTPGVSAQFGNSGFAIRGVRQSGISQGRGNSLLISTTVDGAAISNNQDLVARGPYSLWDLEQIEFLRGPQSTQSGRNALAGAIAIRSKDPTFRKELKARGDIGNFDSKGGAVALNIPLNDLGLAFRLTGDLKRTDGPVQNVTLNKPASLEESDTYRVGVLWEPNDDFKAIFKYTRFKDLGGSLGIDLDRYPGARETTANVFGFSRSAYDSFNLRLSQRLTAHLTLQSETTYYKNDFQEELDNDQALPDTGQLKRTRDFDNFTQELKLVHKSQGLNAALGVFYTEFDRDADLAFDQNTALPPVLGGGVVTTSIISKTIDNVKNAA
ncbi:MAG: TonB-dependent receptor, partial [Pseudomonadota bacterium]